MVETFILLVSLCSPGAWSGCSNGIHVERVYNIPSKEDCEAAGKEFSKDPNYVSYICIKQSSEKK